MQAGLVQRLPELPSNQVFVAEVFSTGGVKPVLDETHFSLEESGQADARLESGPGMDKVVIKN